MKSVLYNHFDHAPNHTLDKYTIYHLFDDDGNQLLENRDGFFVPVSADKGVYSSAIGFGLGITLSDFNGDHWPDLFISNDYFEKDYLYINQSGEGFIESSNNYFDALSMG